MQEFKKKKKKKHGSGITTLIISNEKMNDLMKNNHVLEDCSILLKEITKKLKMKQNNKTEAF